MLVRLQIGERERERERVQGGGIWVHLPPMHCCDGSQQSAAEVQFSNSFEHPLGGPQ